MVIICVNCKWSENVANKMPLVCPKCGKATFSVETALDRFIDKNAKQEKGKGKKK